MTAVITRAIHEFVARDWRALRASKDRYWAERIARLGVQEAFRIAEELRRQALEQQPSWPSAADRAADVASHVHLAELLRRAAPARRD